MLKLLKRTDGVLTARQTFWILQNWIISCHQVKDMQTKLDEAEQLAVQGGRKVTSRLEQKIKVQLSRSFGIQYLSFFQDLETQFDDEHRRLVEAEKSQRRTERRIKELTFSQEEDHKNHEVCFIMEEVEGFDILFCSGCKSWWTSCRTR